MEPSDGLPPRVITTRTATTEREPSAASISRLINVGGKDEAGASSSAPPPRGRVGA